VSRNPKAAIFVTGAASGSGRACADRLADAGYRVYGTYLTEEERHAMVGGQDRRTGVRRSRVFDYRFCAYRRGRYRTGTQP